MSAHDDGNGARVTVAQDSVDFIEGHAVHWRLVDFHDLITTPAKNTHRNLKIKQMTVAERGPLLNNLLPSWLLMTSQQVDFLHRLTKTQNRVGQAAICSCHCGP